ncbi:MAG: TetR/AcrR family transcriptional repressor of nem operon [Polaribacter sp.]|jgi:TetR/AcrR family transcriptional repressor of nem operon
MARTKEFDKTEVLEKAKQLFWKQGFHATSIQNLVDHLGINRASIYDTFGDKNKLYEMALRSYRDESAVQLQKRTDKFKSIKNGLRTLLREGITAALNDGECKGCFVVNCTSEYLPKHQHILPELLENKIIFENTFSRTLQRGKDNGELSADLNVKDLAAYFYTFFNGIQIIAKVKPNKKELFKTIDLGLRVLDVPG